MAKSQGSDTDKEKVQILEGLRKALDGTPKRLQGSPTNPGLFPGGRAGDALAKQALSQGFLQEAPSPEPQAKKGKGKPAVHVCLTESGRQFVLESDSPRQVLSALREDLNRQTRDLTAGLQTSRVEILAWREAAEHLHKTIQAQFNQFQQTVQAFHAILEHLAKTPPVPVSIVSPPLPPSASPPGNWLDEVVQIVTELKKRNSFDRPSLPQIFGQIHRNRPGLTLGQFHDGLRTLHAQRRIRLTPYTQALATLEDAQNALYLDREVKFYVDLP